MMGGKNTAGYPDPTATIAIGNVDRERRKEKRMKKTNNRRYQTTREVYKTAKKYDHAQFDAFCTNIYTEGWKDGVRAEKGATTGLDYEQVLETIQTAKGVGPKTMDNIKAVLEERYAKAKEGNR